MKRFMILWLMMLIVVGLSVHSHAALTYLTNGNGDDVVYDDHSGQYWMWDLSKYTGMNYVEQSNAISMDMGFYGLGGWHMASGEDIDILFSYYEPSTFAIFNPSYVAGSYSMRYGRGGGRKGRKRVVRG